MAHLFGGIGWHQSVCQVNQEHYLKVSIVLSNGNDLFSPICACTKNILWAHHPFLNDGSECWLQRRPNRRREGLGENAEPSGITEEVERSMQSHIHTDPPRCVYIPSDDRPPPTTRPTLSIYVISLFYSASFEHRDEFDTHIHGSQVLARITRSGTRVICMPDDNLSDSGGGKVIVESIGARVAEVRGVRSWLKY